MKKSTLRTALAIPVALHLVSGDTSAFDLKAWVGPINPGDKIILCVTNQSNASVDDFVKECRVQTPLSLAEVEYPVIGPIGPLTFPPGEAHCDSYTHFFPEIGGAQQVACRLTTNLPSFPAGLKATVTTLYADGWAAQTNME